MLLLLVIAAVGALGRRGWPEPARGVLALVGVVVLIAGVVVAGLALTGLGSALTAMPAPLEGQTLRTTGIYALVRHPIYGGLVLMALGFSLLTSPWALLPTAALAVVLDLKRRVEEDFLTATYTDYPAYLRAVPHALVPYVW
jgi:protein-S-isoprenylcysteine O-methyltransferase Ste14